MFKQLVKDMFYTEWLTSNFFLVKSAYRATGQAGFKNY